MSAALGDPYLLATYGFSSASRKGKEKEVVRDPRPFVFASHCAMPKRDNGGHVTLAVQGDGIHVFELGDLHPISSRTLGPSTSFASAPATIICTEDEKSVRRTYIAVHNFKEVKDENAGRVIWAWKERASGDTGSSQDKQSATLGHNVTHLFALQDLNSIIAVSSNGQFSLLDLDLNVKNSWSPKDTAQKAKKLFTFSRHHCRFLPQTASQNGCILVMFWQRDNKLLLQIIAFGLDGEMSVLDPLEVLSDLGEVLDISCDSSGNMSVLGSNGTWTHHLLDIKNGLTSVSPGSSPLHLKAISSSEMKRTRPSQVSLLSLGSSFVLLAGTTSKEIALLLWDVQYGVLLHSFALPIPTVLERSTHGFSLHLSKGSASQAILILSPIFAGPKYNNQSRACVLIVPFFVPKVSTIASALGKAAQSAQWLSTDPSSSMPADADMYGREAMLTTLQEALEERKIKVAEDIFFDWLKNPGGFDQGEGTIAAAAERVNASERRQTDGGSIEKKSSSTPAIRDRDENETPDVEMMEGKAPKTQEVKKPVPMRHLLSHSFVTRLLSMMLDLDEPHGKPCPQRICRYLVTRDLVSNSMVEGGLLWALLQYRDWETIRECFLHVVDLPESDLMRVLLFVVRHQRIRSAKEKDAMEVGDDRKKRKSRITDQWYGVPTPIAFLARVVDYPVSPAASRAALREHFTDVDDLIFLLEIAKDWLRTFLEKGLTFTLAEATVGERDVPASASTKSKEPTRMKAGSGSLPSLENLLIFLQTILDSSFITLLQNPASHILLQDIADTIAPILQENLELEGLRGPLDLFARAQSRAVAETANGGKRREEVDWRKRRKQMHEQAAINLGPYQVEELVF